MRPLRGPRRAWVKAGLAATTAILALSACTSAPAPRPRPADHDPRPDRDPRPNVVFILTDDLTSDLVQYMPHVQALQRAGTTFANHFVVDSLCCPSRAAIFTGQYPHNNGVFTNHGSTDGGYHTFNRNGDDKRTFALALQRAGYRTGFMGKYLNEYQPVDHKPRGWDDWIAAGNGYPEFNYVLNENGALHRYGHRPDDYLTDVLSRKADDFLGEAAHGTKPFALEIATFAPHRPSTPAPRDRNSFPTIAAPRGPAFDRAPTDAPKWLAGLPPLDRMNLDRIERWYKLRVEAVQSVDRLIGRLQEKLDAEGLLGNTYFVFTSDNGYHMGQYRLLPGKQTAFDTDIKVPLVVTGPGVPAGRTVRSMTSSIDLAPSFAAVARTKPAGTPDGTSLLSLWHGDAVPANWQDAILVEHHGPDFAPHDPDRQTVRQANPPSYEAMRTSSSLYVEYKDGDREYYDLAADPHELRNLIPTTSASRLAQLHDDLHRLIDCHGSSSCQAAADLG